MRNVDPKTAQQSLVGDLTEGSYLGTTRHYTISNGKIVTELAGTPIEVTIYKVGNDYLAARSNEFGYANYKLVPIPKELSPL